MKLQGKLFRQMQNRLKMSERHDDNPAVDAFATMKLAKFVKVSNEREVGEIRWRDPSPNGACMACVHVRALHRTTPHRPTSRMIPEPHK